MPKDVSQHLYHLYTGILNCVSYIQTGTGDEGYQSINSFKNEQCRGHMVAIE